MKELRKTYLQDFRDSWTLCAHCGTCNARGPVIPHNWKELPPPEWTSPYHRCPSFEHFNFRTYNAQGRGILAMRVFDDKDFPLSDDLMKAVYTCTSCGVCSDICKATDPLTAIWALREELVRRGAELPEPLGKIHRNIDQTNNMFGSAKPVKMEGVPTEGEDIYFAGCNARFTQPKVIQAVLKTLKAAGIEAAYLGEEEKCCGFIPGHDGQTDLLEQQAMRNIETLKEAGCKRLIVSCAHCYKAFTVDYPMIVGELPFQVVHYAELLSQLIKEKKVSFTKRIEKKVTYHDPCFLGRHCGVYDAPREVLSAIPGLELAEMERNRRWSYCCGSGAKISGICYPEFGNAVTKERLQEGMQAADHVVTACTTCVSQMSRVARNEKMDVEIDDISTLAAEAMGIELP
ncbi:MAG: (Fe-S)-binding protein [Oscillospiraceae bacterium]|nr:(Fe-S)-binding protein [Oscillospiraceae bacterium]